VSIDKPTVGNMWTWLKKAIKSFSPATVQTQLTLVPTALVVRGGALANSPVQRGDKQRGKRHAEGARARTSHIQTGKGVGSVRTRHVGRARAAGRAWYVSAPCV